MGNQVKRIVIAALAAVILLSGCISHPQKLDLVFLWDGELHTESITLDFIDKDCR